MDLFICFRFGKNFKLDQLRYRRQYIRDGNTTKILMRVKCQEELLLLKPYAIML